MTNKDTGSSNNRRRSSDGPEADEERLVRLAKEGDAAAFGGLVELHRDRVFNLAARMTGNRAAAEDLAQDVFVKAYCRIGSFRGDSAFSTWLYSLTLNHCRDFLKNAARREEPSGKDLLAEERDTSPNPEEAAGRGERVRRLEEAYLKLAPIYREAFLLRFVEGLDFRELALAIGQSESGAKMRVARALAKLRERLTERNAG